MALLDDVPAVILAGGLGTRLRSAVADRPKVLADVAGRPFLTYLLQQLAVAGVHEVVICTGFMANHVEAALGHAFGPLRLRYSPEPVPLGTGGALRLALPLLAGRHSLVLNGDSYCSADFSVLAAGHETSGAKGTILLAQVEDASRFGRVHVDAQGQVSEFREKESRAEPGWINAGIYLLDHELLACIPPGKAVSLEKDVFPAWIGRGLYAQQCPGCHFLDIGTPASYREAEGFFAAANRGCETSGGQIEPDG